MFFKKPLIGYQDNPYKTRKKKISHSWLSNLVIAPRKKISYTERLVKFLIFLSLRIVIRPKKWKYPEKNYKIIDYTYQKIISSDFIFIPSSIAFYLIMAFMPIVSLIYTVHLIPGLETWMQNYSHDRDSSIISIIGKFIPGGEYLLKEINNIFNPSNHLHSRVFQVGSSLAIIFFLLSSTWIAASGFAKLVFTQSYVYEHKYVGGYWMNKLRGMFIVIFFSLFLIFILLLNFILKNAILYHSYLNYLGALILERFVTIIILFGEIFCGFILFYKFSPRYKIAIKNIIPGTMTSTIPIVGFLVIFSYIVNLWDYSLYGIIGSIMYIGIGSLIIIFFVFTGIIANYAYLRTFVGKKVLTKWTLSKK